MALDTIPAGWKLTVRLVSEDGKEVNGDHDPIGGLYPLADWRKGEYVTDRHPIHIDMNRTKTGTYGAWLGFTNNGRPVKVTTDLDTDDRYRVRLGTVTIVRGQN